jgi:hypothetical protein
MYGFGTTRAYASQRVISTPECLIWMLIRDGSVSTITTWVSASLIASS